MKPEITLDDYKSIGTMDTALSEHADEAFFELSPEQQKIAEKIFKCLTETDRENRETRRAMTVEKLCAVAEADFTEVAAVIEIFRKEGRTFLMPPPEAPLNENSLVDISHESLIRKWERLKKWVEEEGQSSRLYRRLAEDALLYKQEKMGFWSDPELKDALEWRENFKPNETWAQLYKETGERQFKASFADSMRYLDESEINRDTEIAEDKRQQDALKKYAKNLRWAAIGLVFFLILTTCVALVNFYQRKELAQAKAESDILNEKLKHEVESNVEAYKTLQTQKETLESKQEELRISFDKQAEAIESANKQKKLADEKTREAKLSEAAKQEALDQQKLLADKAQIAEDDAIKERDTALAAENRNELNRKALTLLEQGEFKQSRDTFIELLGLYENNNKRMKPETRTDGKWWVSHNLGIVNSKLNDFTAAEKFYERALNILGERPTLDDEKNREDDETIQSQNSRQYFRTVSYQTGIELTRNKVTTLRRLAQLYNTLADKSLTDKAWQFNLSLAIKTYNRLIKIQEAESLNKQQPDYMVDVYVELADCLAASPEPDDYNKAKKLYETAAGIYNSRTEYGKQVDVLRKWADAAMSQQFGETAFAKLVEAIDIQENVLDLSPVNTEIENSYDQLARARELTAEGEEYEDTRYAELFELIRDVNYAANKTDYLDRGKVKELADAYIKIGKCRRAAKLYDYAIDWLKQKSSESKILGGSYDYLYYYIELAELYHTALKDDSNAKISFKNFTDQDNGKLNEITSLDKKLFERAGDFNFSTGDYEGASKYYGYTLQKIEEDIGLNNAKSNHTEAREKTQRSAELVQHKAEVIVKTALISEKQNNLKEAEAKYLDALGLLPLTPREPIPVNIITLRARILINQADFYERHEEKEKAHNIYIALENDLSVLDKYNPVVTQTETNVKELPALKAIVYKKLGDFNRDKVEIAANFYGRAVYYLAGFNDSSAKDKYAPYFKNNELNARYYSDLAKTYEAWMSLSGVELEPDDKIKAKEAREKAANLTLKEQASRCQ